MSASTAASTRQQAAARRASCEASGSAATATRPRISRAQSSSRASTWRARRLRPSIGLSGWTRGATDEPYPAQELLQFGDARRRVGRRGAGEAGGGLRGARVDAAQGALDPGVGDGVRGDRQHEEHGECGAERADAGLREAQGEQAGVQHAEEAVEQLGDER